MNKNGDKAQLNFDFLTDREKNYAEVGGEIRSIIYANPDTGWKVAEIETGAKKQAKICGYLPGIKTGDRIQARCTKTSHPQFGETLQIDEFYSELPYQKEGVIKFMMSCIDGVGEALAERIVGKFKDKALEILEEQPERLLEVEGISEKLLEKIKQSSSSINTSVRELILMGFSPKWAGRIYLKYGSEAASLIRKRPYRLIRDFKGIGFKKAEIIAGNVGVEKMDPERIAAGICFAIDTILQKTGHNFLYLKDVVRAASRLLDIPRAWAESETLSNKGLIIENDMVYLPRYYEAENSVAKSIAEKIKLPVLEVKNFQELIKETESEVKIKFSSEQIEAVKRALINPMTVITGAAGTGKSTLCIGLLKLLDKLGKTYALCAPTGKAANKIENLTGKRASTIHRLFKYSPAEGFRVNAENPLEKDYLIVDEASMVDILLLQALCEGAGKECRIVFIGDPYQLPPVDAGNSLQALIGSYSVSQIMLPEVFRQQKGSTILKNASMINMEKVFPMSNAEDFEFIDTEDPEKMIKALYSSIDKLKKAGYHPIKDINILTPLNKGGGDISVSNLNIRLRDWLNPASEDTSFIVHDREFRIGDKVMQRKNDYDLDIYNGDIGIITEDTRSESRVTVDFDGKEKNIPYSKMDNITLNYAMTVHKSQGSESRAVIFLATRSGCYFLLNKNLFYTAITRAKEKLIMIMPYDVVKMAVGYNVRRQSYLARRIQKLVVGRDKN